MFDLRDVVTYLAQRVGLLHGRVWFGAGNAVNATLTAKQRRNLLRFLNRRGLRFLVFDDFPKTNVRRSKYGGDQWVVMIIGGPVTEYTGAVVKAPELKRSARIEKLVREL
jgi:hypothetical protein